MFKVQNWDINPVAERNPAETNEFHRSPFGGSAWERQIDCTDGTHIAGWKDLVPSYIPMWFPYKTQALCAS